MTKPVYVVEAAFGVAALTDPGAWTDITSFVRSVSTRRGRNHELGRTQAGVASITLDNLDRRFDPTNASGPYYPNVLPMTHIRTRTTAPSATQVFRGFVEDWGQQWGGPAAAGTGDALVTLQAVDAFSVLARMEVRSYSVAVLEDDPLIYWPLTGTVGVDLGSFGAAPTTSAVSGTFGRAAAPFQAYGQTSLDTPGGSTVGARHLGINESTFELDPLTLEGWLLVDAAPGFPAHLIQLTDGATVSNLDVDTAGHVIFTYLDRTSASVDAVGAGTPFASTGVWHHVAATHSGGTVKLYLDGALTDTFSGLPPPKTPFAVATNMNAGQQINGALAHLAVFGTALSPQRIAAHYAADLDTIAPVPSGTAVGYILNAAGWPAGLRTLDAGVSSVTLTPDGTALDILQAIAEDTEHGILVVAPDGKVTFLDRGTLEKRLTASAAFGDGGGAEIAYGDLQLAYDDQDLWTEVEASGEGGPVTVSDPTAVAAYGTRTLSVSTLCATANEVTDQASGLLNRYKAPAVRPQTMGLMGDRAVDQQLTRAIGDRVTIARRPPGGGTLTVNALIEGIDHDLGPDGWPSTKMSLAPPEPLGFWVLADGTYGVLGSTTRLGW